MTTSEQTRRAAWDAIQHRLNSFQCLVLGTIKAFGDDGATDEGLWNAMRTKPLASVVARRNELVKFGYVVDSGRTRRNFSGCHATAWVAVREGQGELFAPATQADRRTP